MVTNFKSAFESIPGRDALLQYEARNYPIRTYVERNGLIFKSITATTDNFVLSQWELISDLREVRVPNIAARNTLTGTTGTSFGVHTPILDNTNVLVLDASADPNVGSVQFARYNYNQGTSSWLLLQVGTGATSAVTSISYSNILNRPFIVSGVTINAGAGLAGGGSVFGSIPAAGGIINLAHADTSTQANLTPTGLTYIQQLKFDTYGHVTGATQSTWIHPDTSSQSNVLNTGRTYIQSISVDTDGHIVSLSSSPWTHPDTSIQADSVNSGNTFIQSIFLDGDGHVTGIGIGIAAGGGSGGSPLKYNGDSGGVLIMNSGATLTFSGGTNILTQRTGNAANPGLKISLNPAGTVGQVQYNGSIGLGASPNFVFDPTNQALTLGTRTGATGQYGMTIGLSNSASQRSLSIGTNNSIQSTNPNGSLAVGFQNRITGGTYGSIAVGQTNIVGAINSIAVGGGHKIIAGYSAAFGLVNTIKGGFSFAIGSGNLVTSTNSFVGGNSVVRQVISSGATSFNFSENNGSQGAGHGALAANCAILGGMNHNIDGGNVRAAIIGGNAIKLTGTTYIDHTAVSNLAIFATPTAGNDDSILTWNSSNKKVGRVLFPSNINSVLFRTATSIGSNTLFSYQTIPNALTIGSRIVGTLTGSTTLVVGSNSAASGTSSVAFGNNTIAGGTRSFAGGGSTNPLFPVVAMGLNSFNFSSRTTPGTQGNFANNAAILGGIGHYIDAGNTSSAIIGGQGISLTGTTYINYVAVPNLAIFTTPTTGSVSDTILTWNSSNKKVGMIPQIFPSYNNVAYVSKNGNDGTAVIGDTRKPYLTITAAMTAMNAAAIATSTNRCLIYVFSGNYSTETISTFYNYIDVQLTNAKINNITNTISNVDCKIIGNGIINGITISAAAKMSIQCSDVNFINVNNINAVVNVNCDTLISQIVWADGQLIVNANIISGNITPSGTGTNGVAIINANLISGGTSLPPIYCIASSSSNIVGYINAGRIISNKKSGTSNIDPAVYVDTNFGGKIFISANEIINSSSTIPPVSISLNQSTCRINIDCKRIVSLSTGNTSAILAAITTGIFSLKSGMQLIPSGSANSIIGTGNVVALGEIYGKNINTGVTIQLGTFTNNATFIV